MGERLLIKITRDNLPQVKDRYPFIYLERCRLEVDDSSVKFIDINCNEASIPIATVMTVLLGPGTSITHEAVKALSASNTTVCWTGEDSLLYYATGISPTATTQNIRKQAELSSDTDKRTIVARRMFKTRFPKDSVDNASIQELMGMEGKRVKKIYEEYADKYKVGWTGRSYVPGKFQMSDMTNKILTSANAALYALCTSAIVSMGFSPHLGFVHSGSPLPFVYDIADLYKEYLCIEFAFEMTLKLAGNYDRHVVLDSFRKRVISYGLLERFKPDIDNLFRGL